MLKNGGFNSQDDDDEFSNDDEEERNEGGYFYGDAQAYENHLEKMLRQVNQESKQG
jgi:hypothetical protein